MNLLKEEDCQEEGNEKEVQGNFKVPSLEGIPNKETGLGRDESHLEPTGDV